MKKLVILAVLTLISFSGFSQTADKHFNQLIDSIGKSYEVSELSSDLTEKYRLNQISPMKVKSNGEIINQYCVMIFLKEGDDTKYMLKTLSTKEAVNALDSRKNYIYVVGGKLFYKEKE